MAPALSDPRSVQRVDQCCVDDSAILRQQRRAEYPGGRHEDSVCWIALKGVGQRGQLRRNGTDEQPRHNVTFGRLYKEADQWKTTQSFGRNDLLVLAKVADQAHSRIFALPQEEEPEAEAES